MTTKKTEEHEAPPKLATRTLEHLATEHLGVTFDAHGRIKHQVGKGAEEALVAGLRVKRGGAVGQPMTPQQFATELAQFRKMEIR